MWVANAAATPPAKPNVWVYTDLTDPRERRDGGHPRGDPDDLVSLAGLLLSAHRFHIESVVVGSVGFSDVRNPLGVIEEVFVPAYHAHVENLGDQGAGYQKAVRYRWSSVTRSGGPAKRFEAGRAYEDIGDYETVRALAEFAQDHAVYVLVWGALTEPAILVKHLRSTGNQEALDNITFVSHWSKSYVKSMHAEELKTDPFAVTNCKMDRSACDYLHEQAAQGAVKLIQLGSAGQTGIVDGSAGDPQIQALAGNPLGQILMSGKSYNNKTDQSDAATFWVLATDLGLGLDGHSADGGLTPESEAASIARFKAAAPAIMDDLRERAAASDARPYPPSFLAEYFTYTFYRWGHYTVYTPNAVNFRVLTPDGAVAREGVLKQWTNAIDLPKKPQGHYRVELLFPDQTVVKPL